LKDSETVAGFASLKQTLLLENNFFVFLKSQIMLVVMQIFQRNILNKYIESLDALWFDGKEIQGN